VGAIGGHAALGGGGVGRPAGAHRLGALTVGQAVDHGRGRVAGGERVGVGRVVALRAGEHDGRALCRPRRQGVGQRVDECLGEPDLGLTQAHPVLRPGRPGDAGLDGRQVELERLGEDRLGRGVEPQALFLGVRLDQGDEVVGPAGEAQVAQRLVVDGEDRDGRPVLGRHVADRGPVLDRDVDRARPVELHEPAHDPVRPQHVGDGEDQVGGGRALGQVARQLEAHHLGDQHRDGLAEQGGLGLDAAHAPAHTADAVDHGGVAVGADQGVGEGGAVAGGDHGGQVFEVDLVADAGGRRHDPELPEGRLPPAEELVALEVALVLQLGVAAQGVVAAVDVDLHGVVDDQVGGDERVEPLGVLPRLAHRVAHGGEVDDRGDAGEVLHEDARRQERDLAAVAAVAPAVPLCERPHVVVGHPQPVVVAQQVLQ
jgi:hypothetical protein